MRIPLRVSVLPLLLAAGVTAQGEEAPVPPSLGAVLPNNFVNTQLPETVGLLGDNLTNATGVTVGGIAVPIVKPENPLTIEIPAGFPTGTHPLVVTTAGGSSNSMPFTVRGTHPSSLVTPPFHTQGITLNYATWTDGGWHVLYLVSARVGTTALPGIVTFDIGGGSFANLIAVATVVADPAGYAELPVTMPVLHGVGSFRLFWECMTYDPAIPLGLQTPLETSNSGWVSSF